MGLSMKVAALALSSASVVLAQGAVDTYTATSAAAVYAAQATALTSSPTSNVPGKAFDRIAIIWLENTDYDMAKDDPNLAWLATKGITLSNYFGVTHPSEPNYCAAIAGDNFGMDNDNFNQIPANVSTVIDLLEARGISWGEYQEDMPYSGFEGYSWVNQVTGANDYVRKHNPAVLFNKNAESIQRLSQIKNLTYFYKDLEANKLPQWMFITPNMTDDGHDTSVTVAGAWTRSFVEPLLNDKRFMQNTLVLITFDETETYTEQNRVFSILLGDAVPKHLVGTTDPNFYDHYSEISTVEANWDLNTLGRWDVGANVFSVVAEQTGDRLRQWPAATGPNPSVFLNQSFEGAFSADLYRDEIPSPDIAAVYNGRWVLPSIIAQWALDFRTSYYNTGVEIPDGLRPPPGW